MDYSHPQRAQLLAAEYLVGTLQGGARRRFEALLPAHPQLRHTLLEWQQLLIPLAGSVPAVPPNPEVWDRIQERTLGPLLPESDVAVAPPAPRWWQRLGPWRAAAAAGLLLSLGLAALLLRPTPHPAPRLVLLSSSGGPPSFVITLAADARSLALAPVGGLTIDAQHALELWAIQKSGETESLGLISTHRTTTLQRRQALDNIGSFGLSVEPPSGSGLGHPSTPLVAVGKLQP
ncbi:MAG: hypothetical protein RJA44_2299 [Pseudomonadota bacterium]|jgi:anti-sigma-K factor RskA